MKSRFLFMMLFITATLFGIDSQTQPGVWNIVDYGYELGSEENTIPSILKMLKEISLEDPEMEKKILFPKATYHFYPTDEQTREYYISNHDQDNPKYLGLPLETLKNVTIEGSDSLFLFHGRMLPVSIVSSENLVLKNLSIDTVQPQIAQVVLIEDNGNKALFREHPETPVLIERTRLLSRGPNWENTFTSSMAFDGEKGHIIPQTSDMGWAGFSGKKDSAGNIHIPYFDTYVRNGRFKPGTAVALRSWARPTPGIFIDASKNIKLENVNVHYAEGMGLLAQMTENIHLDGFNVVVRENTGRYFTTQADATHFSACKGLILSENGTYEGMMDDAINIHGTYLKIIRKKNKNTVVAKYMHPQAYGFKWGNIGDSVQFVKSATMELIGEPNTIQKITALDKPEGKGVKTFEITFENPLSGDTRRNSGIENLTWTPEVIFRNSTIRNNRARGTLFSTPKKTIVENNLFDHTSGTAILLAGDCNGWFETGASKEVYIRNNRFVNSLTSMYQFTNAIISIYPEIPQLWRQKKYFHTNIVIENNTFETFDRPLLYAKSTDGILFQNNTIKKNTDFQPFHKFKWSFFFEKCANISILNNNFTDGYTFDPAQDIKLNKTADVKFEPLSE